MRAGILCCFLVFFLQILCLVGVRTTPFASNHHGFALNINNIKIADQNPQSLQTFLTSNQQAMLKKRLMEMGASKYKEINMIGSSPPSCDHKCYGCMPCEAIQVPTTSSRVGLQYTNYEPEGWKCKCGPTFYSP
ncbi:uncharacterized protein [Primulina huaijiensis]|uniref:uncharacterized protein n=1 Tax=Primulina huaijiensis TaxID=1492673 RepID=UPI003CC7218F